MSDSFRKGRQRLFDLLAQEHGVSALESQVGDIEHCVLSYAQAQAPEPVAVADKGVINWIDGKQFDHEADLYTQPAVNQQLLEAIKVCASFLSDFGLENSDAYQQALFAIAAAQTREPQL